MNIAQNEKAFAAEKNVSIVRTAIVIFNSLIYIFLMDQSQTIPGLAYSVIVVALLYSMYVYIAKPYHRFPVMVSSYFTSISDATLITFWLYATGGAASPFYVIWYAGIISIAFRYNIRETVFAAFVYAISYVLLLAALGELLPNLSTIMIRIGYIFFVGAMGALSARETLYQVQTKLAFQDLTQRLAQETHERKRVAEDLQRSLARLQATLEATADGILAVDQSGRIEGYNQQYRDIWRIPETILASKDEKRIFGFISKQLKEASGFLQTTRSLPDQTDTEKFDILEMKDGRLIDWYVKPQQIEGVRVGWVLSFHDVTEHTKAIQGLEEHKAQLAEAQHLAHIGSWEWDLINQRLIWSDELYRIFGSKPQQFTPTYDLFLEYVHPADRDFVSSTVQTARNTLEPFDFRFRIIHPDSSTRTLHARGITIPDQLGEPVKMLGAVQDITDIKQAEERALELVVEKERVKVLADFVTNASHDFRTPLATIVTSLYLVNKISDWEVRSHHLNTIEQQAARLTELVDGLFTLTQLASGQKFVLRPIDLNQLVKASMVTHEAMLKGRGISVTLKLEEALPDVAADATKLNEALLSLLDNAANYTAEGGSITISTYTSEQSAVIEVRDTGVGITADDLQHIFDPFYRVDKARSTSTGGIGLGLFIAKKVIEKHQGQLEVESKPGEGSTFYMRLPILVEIPTESLT